MFEGFSKRTIDFMWGIRLNNQKSWFEAHKSEYQEVFQAPMRALGQEVFGQIAAAYPNHGFIHKLSRIYRDARRVRDGRPYRDCLWFSIERPCPDEWTSTPVFWFELGPDGWSYGLGFYSARPATMAKLRARIDRDPKKFAKFIAPLAKQSEFQLDGPEYIRPKASPTAQAAPWYNKKTLSLICSQPINDELFSRALVDRLVAGYKFLMPFYDYFASLDSELDAKR